MTFILVDEKTNKVLTCISGDGNYYYMENGDIPIGAMIFDENDYDDFLTWCEDIVDERDLLKIDVEKLTKVYIKRI